MEKELNITMQKKESLKFKVYHMHKCIDFAINTTEIVNHDIVL